MPDYLLDTNILSYWHNAVCAKKGSPSNEPRSGVGARGERVASKIQEVTIPDPDTGYRSRLFISVVTLAEIEYGHKVTSAPNAEAQVEFRNFIEQELPPALEIPSSIIEPYSILRAWLFDKFSDKRKRTKAKRPEELMNPTAARELGIQENDLWIAAHAALFNLVMVTGDSLVNLKEAIEQAGIGPKMEDWTKL